MKTTLVERLGHSKWRELQSALKVTYNIESYLVKVIIVCTCESVPAYAHVAVCMSKEYNNAAVLRHTVHKCSKTIKSQTEVLTSDDCGSKSEAGIVEPLCCTKPYVTSYMSGSCRGCSIKI